MKKCVVFLLLLTGQLAFGQANTQHVKEQAEATAKALLEDDYDKR